MLLFALDAAPSLGSRFAEWFSGTLVGELLAYLKTTYFSVHLGIYEHFSSGEVAERNLEWALFALWIGVVVASIAFLCRKNLVRRYLNALYDAKADAPERAKTLEELGLKKGRGVRKLLSRPTLLARLTQVIVEGGAGESPEAKAPAFVPALNRSFFELATSRLFLPADDLEILLPRYRQKGHPALSLIATILVSIVVLALVMHFLPAALGLLDAIL